MTFRISVIVLLSIIACGTVFAAVQPVWTDAGPAAGNKTVGTAVRFMRVGMWDKAERELRKTLGYRPENHAAQFNLGLCMENKGNLSLARRFYEKAVELRPEPLYCEALARLDKVAGTGVEYVRFLLECEHECDYGFSFARAGLWKEAENRFAEAFTEYPTAINLFNRAVACEVLGYRSNASRFLKQAASLKGRSEFDAFNAYFNTAPDFPLEMRVTLPELTTLTEQEPRTTMMTTRSIALRLEATLDSPVVMLLPLNTEVQVLEDSHSWFRIRSRNQKEGYIQGIFLKNMVETQPDSSSGESYSLPYETPTAPANESIQDGETSDTQEPAPEPAPQWVARVKKDGNPVAVRKEASLLADIVGYVDPGRKIRVMETGDDMWLEIASGRVKGFILKAYIEEPQ